MAEIKNIADVGYASDTPSSSATFYIEDGGMFERATITQIKALLGITTLETKVAGLEGDT